MREARPFPTPQRVTSGRRWAPPRPMLGWDRAEPAAGRRMFGTRSPLDWRSGARRILSAQLERNWRVRADG
jgi:hypothetical protein